MECSSAIPASTFLTKSRKFFAQCQELIKNLDRFSDITNGKSSTECRKGLAQCANKTSQNHPMPTSKAVFTTLPKSFRQNAESLPLTCENGKNTYNFFQKINFLPSFPVDMWNSVSAILLDFFQQKTEKVCSKNEKHRKIYVFSQKAP